MGKIEFFDLNGMIGQPVFSSVTGNFSGYLDAKGLLADMDYFGVSYALVSHWEADFNPVSGNRRLIREIKDSCRFFPCWVVIPHQTREMAEPKDLVNEMRRCGVRAVKLMPGRHGFGLEEWSVGPLLAALEKAGILVIFELPNQGGPVAEPDDYCIRRFYSICKEHPKLKVVANLPLRKLYPLLEEADNLRVGLVWEPHPFVVEDISRRFGPERLLFGTAHCEISEGVSGASKTVVNYSALTQKEKGMIAGENLKRLLGLKNLPPVKFKEPASRFQRLADHAERLPGPIIDNHFHFGTSVSAYKPGGNSVEAVLSLMKKMGVNKICVNSSLAIWAGDHRKGNEEIAAIFCKYPDKFIGFAVINPSFDNLDEEIKRYIKIGFRGIKIHPRIHRCDLGDKRYEPVWTASERYRIPILSHTGEGQAHSDPSAFDRIAGAYPAGTFIIGHSGETLAGIKTSIAIARRYKNVYLDISGWGFMRNGVLEYVVNQVSVEKVLFGSDFNWIDFRYHLGIVLYAKISDKEKAKVLGLNMERLLKKTRLCRYGSPTIKVGGSPTIKVGGRPKRRLQCLLDIQ